MILHPHEIVAAAKLLRQGEIVAFPTETVYGLGAPIFNEKAIEKIFKAKNRPSDNPLIAHISDFQQAESISRALPEEFFLLADQFWPGPLTMVVAKRKSVPNIASAGLDSIGLRMPAHPLAILLIEEVGEPLVAPSANLSGKPSSTCVDHVLHDFEGKIAAVLDGGPCEIGLESTVIDLTNPQSPKLLRSGAISVPELEIVLRKPIVSGMNSEEAPRSPGMKYRHYAPKAKIIIAASLEEIEEAFHEGCHVLAPSGTALRCPYVPLLPSTFYAELRAADADGKDSILIYCDASSAKNSALMDRLQKAAGLY